jgi:hypothetical protein
MYINVQSVCPPFDIQMPQTKGATSIQKKSVRTVNVYFTKNEGEGGEIEGYFSFSFRHHQYALYSTIDSYL